MGKIAYAIICLVLIAGCTPKDAVYCPKCHKALNKLVEYCPKDQAPLNGYKYWFWSRDRRPPVMAFNAKTYLIKRDGKFVWHPFEVDLKD